MISMTIRIELSTAIAKILSMYANKSEYMKHMLTLDSTSLEYLKSHSLIDDNLEVTSLCKIIVNKIRIINEKT